MGSLVDTELFDKGKPLPGVEPKEAGLKGIITCHSANKSLDQVPLMLDCGCAHNISVNSTVPYHCIRVSALIYYSPAMTDSTHSTHSLSRLDFFNKYY